jgi:hypothetical protein
MPEPKKRVYAAESSAALKVHLTPRPTSAGKQPADSPQIATSDHAADEQRQEVINRLIDFFKAL